jgi:squalene-hopene/tetraprenyl-beta-curcumene cyclase
MKVSLRRRPFLLASASLVAGASLASLRVAWGQDEALLGKAAAKGVDFLKKSQLEDGSYNKQMPIGITGIAVSGLLANGLTAEDPTVKKALALLEKGVKPDGGIYGRMATYETSVAVTAFAAANKDGRFDKLLANANKFLRKIPFGVQDESIDKANSKFGGVGYGGPGRPDLSNTAFFIDALKSLGAGGDDQAIQNALTFVNRCQNLESEHNSTEYANKINDGGFYYSPLVNDDKEEEPNGGLRSYGAMSYSGLKSMVFAGLTKDDPRVKAVLKWISKNYSVETQPGRGDAGLYYYYLTMAKGLQASGLDTIEDESGKKHDWRAELTAELVKRQNSDGSWVNSNSQFMEGDANLCTSMALVALGACKKK